MQEQEAVRRLKAGDISGLEALVRPYQVPAVQTACLITRNRSLAEDIVQATFLRVYERIGQFDESRPFRPWFLRSVINDALKAANRAQRQVPLEAVLESEDALLHGDAWLADSRPTPEESLEAVELRDRLRAALDRLTPVQRVGIVQRYYLDLSESEMADELGCPPRHSEVPPEFSARAPAQLAGAALRPSTLIWLQPGAISESTAGQQHRVSRQCRGIYGFRADPFGHSGAGRSRSAIQS